MNVQNENFFQRLIYQNNLQQHPEELCKMPKFPALLNEKWAKAV